MKKKKNKILIFSLFFLSGLASCKKITSIDTDPIATVNIVNAINAGGGVKLNLNREVVSNNTFQIQAIYAGSGNIKAYDAVSNAVYYNQPQETVNGGLYSLYLTGTATSTDGVWVKDSIKAYGSANTTTTVRVVNLSNAGPVNVSLASATATNVFANVAYKSVTTFQDFPMPLSVPSGTTTFQFKDAANTVVASFTLPESARNRSYTIVLKGLSAGAGTSAIGCIGQQHY